MAGALSGKGGPLPDINTALEASKDAMEQLILAGERAGTTWTSPRAPGKWSPSQVVEHVARSLEESANMAAGRPAKFPRLPGVIHPIVRGLLFQARAEKGRVPEGEDQQGDGSSERTSHARGGTHSP